MLVVHLASSRYGLFARPTMNDIHLWTSPGGYLIGLHCLSFQLCHTIAPLLLELSRSQTIAFLSVARRENETASRKVCDVCRESRSQM